MRPTTTAELINYGFQEPICVVMRDMDSHRILDYSVHPPALENKHCFYSRNGVFGTSPRCCLLAVKL